MVNIALVEMLMYRLMDICNQCALSAAVGDDMRVKEVVILFCLAGVVPRNA